MPPTVVVAIWGPVLANKAAAGTNIGVIGTGPTPGGIIVAWAEPKQVRSARVATPKVEHKFFIFEILSSSKNAKLR